MQTFTLPRSGNAPLKFAGELLAREEGEQQLDKQHNRWHDLYLYARDGGGFVVSIIYNARWKGETGHESVHPATDAAEVCRVLRKYDPTAAVQGYPLGDAFKAKQARLLADIKARYNDQVKDLLDREELAEEAEIMPYIGPRGIHQAVKPKLTWQQEVWLAAREGK